MTEFEMTRDEAHDLARYVARIRARLGHQHTWDRPGIEDALARARGMAPGPELAVAAIRAAANPGNRTPAIIALDGPHWRAPDTRPKTPPVPVTERCSICDNVRDVCESRWSGDHAYSPRPLRTVVKAAEHLTGRGPIVAGLMAAQVAGQSGDDVTPDPKETR